MGAFGALVVTDAAVVAGVASMPDPVTDADDDGWFLWVPFAQKASGSSSGTIGFQYDFDSKAMRKLSEGFSVAFILANTGDDPLEFSVAISLLAGRS